MQNPNKFFEDMSKMAQGVASVMVDMSKKMAQRFEGQCKDWQTGIHSACAKENKELRAQLEKLQKDHAELMKKMSGGGASSTTKSSPSAKTQKKASPKKTAPEKPSQKGASKKSAPQKKA